jgi:hypothetical protein
VAFPSCAEAAFGVVSAAAMFVTVVGVCAVPVVRTGAMCREIVMHGLFAERKRPSKALLADG